MAISNRIVVRRRERTISNPLISLWLVLRNKSLILPFAMFVLGCQFLYAEPPEIVCSVSENELFVGESLTYQVELRNAENPNAPDIAVIRDLFTVEFTGDQSRNQSSTMIINGRISQSATFSHVYQYRLTPKQAGVQKIPPVTALIDGKTIASNSLSIRVLEIPEQDKVIPEIIPSQAKVYPTQSFSIKLRILVQPISNLDPMRTLKQLRISPPTIQINWLKTPEGLSSSEVSEWLQPMISKSNVGFSINEVTTDSGFLFDRRRSPVFDFGKGRATRNGLSGQPIDYFVYELERTFVAERAGVYTFGPAIVRGTLDTRFVAIAPAVNVEVSQVPSPRPSNFTGGIGSYSVNASATPKELRVGDPMTLTFQFAKGKNSGSLELISAPDLNAIPEISEQFDIVDKNPVGRVEGSTKKFAFGLRPKRPGVSIPSVSLSTFDPVTESFTNVSTAPIAINVSAASASIVGGDLVGVSGSQKNANEIKSRSEGIFHNVTDLSQISDERIDLFYGMRWVAGLWLGSGGAIASLIAMRRKSSDAGRLRRASARRKAHAKLSAASTFVQHGKEKECLSEVRSAIFGLIADLQNQIAEGLTAADVNVAMTNAAVPIEYQQRLQTLLEKIESAEYGASQPGDSKAIIKGAGELIDILAPYLERRSTR